MNRSMASCTTSFSAKEKKIEKKLKPINGFLHQPAKGKKFEFLF